MPHTITIYNKFNDKYIKNILKNVYWYGSDSINVSGKGIVDGGNINIIIDNDNLKNYVSENLYDGKNNTYTIQKGARIVLGECIDIVSLNDIPKTFKQVTIFGINENIVGSNVDNILIIAK